MSSSGKERLAAAVAAGADQHGEPLGAIGVRNGPAQGRHHDEHDLDPDSAGKGVQAEPREDRRDSCQSSRCPEHDPSEEASDKPTVTKANPVEPATADVADRGSRSRRVLRFLATAAAVGVAVAVEWKARQEAERQKAQLLLLGEHARRHRPPQTSGTGERYEP